MTHDDLPKPSRPLSSPASGSTDAAAPWQAPAAEDIQFHLPQHEVIELLGRGGMGAVYKARQLSVDRIVAIKVLPRRAADDGLKFAERFKQEARAMARLAHPGIVQVFDAGQTADGLLYIVMEFVEGTDVARLIEEKGRIGAEEAVRIAKAVCEALSFAHANGIVHRDIKPANVMFDARGQVKVADFGLAKMDAGASAAVLTQSSVMMGSPDFIAPEALKRGAAMDHRADIFAVGVMLYQMLTGELPRGMFKLPSRLAPELDERLDAIVCKAMEPDPPERFQSAEELRAALDGLSAAAPRVKPKRGRWLLAAAAIASIGIVAALVLPENKNSMPAGNQNDAPEWQPVFAKAEDFAGRRAKLEDGWAVLTDRPLTIGRDIRDGAIRASSVYHKAGVGSVAVRANSNGHTPVIAFITKEGAAVAINFWPDMSSKDSSRNMYDLPKPLAEGEEYMLELSAQGDEFRVSVNGVEAGRATRSMPQIVSGTMGVVPDTKGTVKFRDIAWREFSPFAVSR